MKHLLLILALVPLAACQSFVRSVEAWTPEGRPEPPSVTPIVVLPALVSVGDRAADGTFLRDSARTVEATHLLQAQLDRALAAHGGFEVRPQRYVTEAQLLSVSRSLERYEAAKGIYLLPQEEVQFGDAFAFLSAREDEMVLLPVASQWTPTAGRESWGWFTGAFMAHAPTGCTQLELLLVDPRSGQLEWVGAYCQSATAGWKTAALTEEESIARILEDVLAERPAPAAPAGTQG